MSPFSKILKILVLGTLVWGSFISCSRISPEGNGAGYEDHPGSTPSLPSSGDGNGTISGPINGPVGIGGNLIATCTGSSYTVQLSADNIQVSAANGAILNQTATVTSLTSGYQATSASVSLFLSNSASGTTGTLEISSGTIVGGDGAPIAVTCQIAQ